MVATASEYNAKFVVNTGDNFYWCGIQNTSDVQINVDFVKPYDELGLNFYSVLGNHEYGYNVSAQLDYATMNPKWIIDDRYYSRRMEATTSSSSANISFIFLDTSPCVTGYRASNPANYDPCSTSYPTCSIDATDDDFEGPCEFNANILTQNCTAQYDWFVQELDAADENDWLVVVGHHPLDEVTYHDFISPLNARGFSIYLNGHAHTLTQYTINNAGAWVTSGAGSMVDTVDQTGVSTSMKVQGMDITGEDIERFPIELQESYTYQTVYNTKTAGFTLHTFSADFSYLTTDFVSYNGATLHSFNVYKNGTTF